MRVKFLIVYLLFVYSTVFTQVFKKTATSGFTFLEIPVTARTASLGESSIALADNNSNSVFNNPGALGFQNSIHSFSVSYAPWFADIKHYSSSYSFNSNYGVLALGIIMFDYGTMPRTIVASGQKVYSIIGSFNALSLAFSANYSKKLTNSFSFGLGLKYVEEKIDIYKAKNILFDGGFLYYTGLGSLRIAGVIQNFGVNSKFINDEFRMPSMLRLGLAGEVFGNDNSQIKLTLTSEAIHASDNTEKLHFGSELSWNNVLFLRGGYKFFYDEDTYSLGFGVKNTFGIPIVFDFAFSDYTRLGKILRFTLQMELN